ncbi:hypothetical protein [Synechococcus sp. CCY 9618]|uniref:hypothetical protein n=1 Tax=Synechococcus sp. CCY 9618 TaxID=2815602 RepID=UPI001C21BD21|nr:hypothetical protein [Synechococcus sp. CCY 9618]
MVLSLAAGQLVAPLQARQLPGEDFGRWQRPLARCRILMTTPAKPAPPPDSCRLLRLDQQMEGLLTVRFLQPGSGESLLDRQLVFAGVLEEGSPGLSCRQSRCEPSWPLLLRVSAVGQSGYGAMGTAMPLTRARLARGHCLLKSGRFSCEATGQAGELWQAEASP